MVMLRIVIAAVGTAIKVSVVAGLGACADSASNNAGRNACRYF
jgi:hypothetical protein